MAPLRYGPRRAQRYDALIRDGFFPFEAAAFSKLRKAPALTAMRNARRITLASFERKAKRQRMTPNERKREFRKQVNQLYLDHGWTVKQGPKGKQRGPKQGKKSPFEMYRHYEKGLPPPPEIEEYRKKKRHGGRVAAATVAELRERQSIRKLKSVR